MGLILDSSILIAGERRGDTLQQIIHRVNAAHGDLESALSAISIIELTHGIYRSKTQAQRASRQSFVDELSRDMIVHPVSIEIARLAGRIEGEQAARGISIAVEDLVIGTTALVLGYGVATLNLGHFQAIPNLRVVTL
ncbi:MAG TPA: PIN domain-containing protein [Acidobacteriaceae bacterium]|nr:PIN domain-containing protein [Acidobacteriaceae bacterium]